MKKVIAAVLLAVLVCVVVISPPAQASLDFYCKHAMYNPTYAVICFWLTMMEFWNPLDWGDSDQTGSV
jgi:hypothetical protein